MIFRVVPTKFHTFSLTFYVNTQIYDRIKPFMLFFLATQQVALAEKQLSVLSPPVDLLLLFL